MNRGGGGGAVRILLASGLEPLMSTFNWTETPKRVKIWIRKFLVTL